MTSIPFDLTSGWTWFLLVMRLTGVFHALPGVGTDEVPLPFRSLFVLVLAAVLVTFGAEAQLPNSIAEAGLMIGTEMVLGYVLGAIPALIVASLALSGQLTSTAIGLGQASLIDPSLGEHVSALSRIEQLLATALFLAVDGHHAVIRAASTVSKDVGIGMFRPDAATAEIFLTRFQDSFNLAITLSGPIIVVTLVMQFIFGLITKFVPQMNIFFMSMPITILLGLFVFEYTLPEMLPLMLKEFARIDEIANAYLTR